MKKIKLVLNESLVTNINTNQVDLIEDVSVQQKPDYQIIDITVIPDEEYNPTIQSILIDLDESSRLCESAEESKNLSINILSETVNIKTGYSNSLFEFENKNHTITLSLVLQETERKGIYKVEAYTTKGEKVFESNTYKPKKLIESYLNSLANEYLIDKKLNEGQLLKEHNDVTLIKVNDSNRRNIPGEVNNILKSYCDSKNIDMDNIQDVYVEMIEDYPMNSLGDIYASIWSPDAGLTNCYKFSSYSPNKPTYLGTAEEKSLASRIRELADFDYISEAEEIIKTLKDDEGGMTVKVIKAPNGRYFNYYYSTDEKHWDSSAGPFNTAEEAITMAKKHRPNAKELKESTDGEIEKLKKELRSRAEDLYNDGELNKLSAEDINNVAQSIKRKGFFISNNIFTDDSDEYEWQQINDFLDNELRDYDKNLKESVMDDAKDFVKSNGLEDKLKNSNPSDFMKSVDKLFADENLCTWCGRKIDGEVFKDKHGQPTCEKCYKELNESEEINWKEEEKKLLGDVKSVKDEALKRFYKIFVEQGKTKFAERVKKEMDRRGLKEAEEDLRDYVIPEEFKDNPAEYDDYMLQYGRGLRDLDEWIDELYDDNLNVIEIFNYLTSRDVPEHYGITEDELRNKIDSVVGAAQEGFSVEDFVKATELTDEVKNLNIDYSKWNDATQEERIELVTPELNRFYNKYKVDFEKNPDLFSLVLYNLDDENFHTEANVLRKLNGEEI